MIQTEVKTVSPNVYQVHVTVAQAEYDKIYASMMQKITTKAKMPGFRPGKTPLNVIKSQFGPKLHEDTVSEIIQTHYVASIEKSGLTPALQPLLDVPAVQPANGFEFTLKVTTWPTVEVAPLDQLSFDETTITVDDADVQSVIDRLLKSQVSFEIVPERVSENGDQLHIDFCGSIDGEEFEGGKGDDVPLVLGEGRFISGFEEQLLGKLAGDEVMVEVTFPADYQAAHLAGKSASFDTTVKSVAKPLHAANEEELAKMLKFDDAAALRADAVVRLEDEAVDASFSTTRLAALDALVEANDIALPDALIEEDMKASTRRILENMKQQGMEPDPSMLDNDDFRVEVRDRSEKGLKLSVLLQKIREGAKLQLEEAAVDAEIDRQSAQYPEEQREQYKVWLRGQKEQIGVLRDRLLERLCITFIVAQAATNKVSKALSVWQQEQEQS
ncbi:MAG: trigger factor [Mariprofundus sp.]|nr:trigger factor [Mariprofundus sp.]